ncbi:hypothetical protein Emag_001732 [Eimeria magna]
MEDSYKHNFYSNKAHINTIQQAIIIFLWIGIRWLIFGLNLLFLFSALAFVLTNSRAQGSAMLVSRPTSERLRGILIVILLLVVNLISCYVREHDDRQTYIVNQEASALERRSLELLNDMLPKELLVEFQNDNLRLAYSHESLAFLFADICGFTAWSRTRLFTRFDRDTIALDLYKLCTIGDAYVAVSGLRIDSLAYETLSGHHEGFSGRHGAPGGGAQTDAMTGGQWRSQWENLNGAETGGWREHRETDEAGRILSMARQMLEHVQAVREEMQIPGLDMRIGLHVGSCVGGVIGSRRLRYDLWGLDVLVGNDIESNGVPGQICCSQEFKSAFQKEKHNEPRCCE